MIRNAPRDAAVFGVDLGKNIFHVVGLDNCGVVVQRVKFRRDASLAFFERATRTVAIAGLADEFRAFLWETHNLTRKHALLR
jgi:hypothetical protein